MIDSKRLLFSTDSATEIETLFECIPLCFCVLSWCTLFNGVSAGFMVGNVFWMRGAIIPMINLLILSWLADALIRVLFVKRKTCFTEIGVAFARAKMPFCPSVVRTLHFELFTTAVTNREKIIGKGCADFFSNLWACFVPRLKTFYSFWQINHLNVILPHIARNFNIHDNPELLEVGE